MMTREEQTESAAAVAITVMDFFQVLADEIVFDVKAASDLIEEYADRRVREARGRPDNGKVVRLRAVSGSGGCRSAADECAVCGARVR
jgi:hypothetical protein